MNIIFSACSPLATHFSRAEQPLFHLNGILGACWVDTMLTYTELCSLSGLKQMWLSLFCDDTEHGNNKHIFCSRIIACTSIYRSIYDFTIKYSYNHSIDYMLHKNVYKTWVWIDKMLDENLFCNSIKRNSMQKIARTHTRAFRRNTCLHD